jgi:hypothetical protein
MNRKLSQETSITLLNQTMKIINPRTRKWLNGAKEIKIHAKERQMGKYAP